LFCIFKVNRLVFKFIAPGFTDESLRFIETFSKRLKSKQLGPLHRGTAIAGRGQRRKEEGEDDGT
jgi:hypothetical protein